MQQCQKGEDGRRLPQKPGAPIDVSRHPPVVEPLFSPAGQFGSPNQPPKKADVPFFFLEGTKAPAKPTPVKERDLAEALNGFYHNRFTGEEMCEFIAGLDRTTAQEIASIFNTPKNTYIGTGEDLCAFLRGRLEANRIKIENRQVLEGVMSFLAYDAEFYATRKACFEALDKKLTRKYGKKENPKSLDFHRIMIVDTLAMGTTSELCVEIAKRINKIFSYYPKTGACTHFLRRLAHEYPLDEALNDFGSALGGLTCKDLRKRRVRLRWKIVETGHHQVKECTHPGFYTRIHSSNGIGFDHTWHEGTYATRYEAEHGFSPSIVLKKKRFLLDFAQENFQKRPVRTTILSGAALLLGATFLTDLPPPQRFITTSQRLELMKDYDAYSSVSNPIERLIAAEYKYRCEHAEQRKALTPP